MINLLNKIKYLLFGILGIGIVLTVGADLTKNEISTTKLQIKYDQAAEIKAKYNIDGSSLKRIVKDDPKDKIEVIIGDENKTEFTPDIRLSRWDEVFFKIKPDLEGIATKDKDLSFNGDKIKFDTPKMSFGIYEYAENEEGYKYIWYLNEKPASNKVEFDIETSGLNFFYQPPLTQEYQNGYSEEFKKEIIVSETQVKDLEGNVLVERPENIVGSYAVYHQTKGGMNDINGKEYKTGQAFMIYRPHIIDAEGKETWGILKIENGIYSVEIPQDFLDKAQFPIRSNDTFGYTTAGGTNITVGPGGSYNMIIGKFALSANGDVSKLTASCSYVTSAKNGKGYIYDNTGTSNTAGTQKGLTPATAITSATQAWKDFTFDSSFSLIANDYWLGVVVDADYVNFYFNSSGVSQFRDPISYDIPPNPWNYQYEVGTNKYSIYATYTPSGGTERRIIITE